MRERTHAIAGQAPRDGPCDHRSENPARADPEAFEPAAGAEPEPPHTAVPGGPAQTTEPAS